MDGVGREEEKGQQGTGQSESPRESVWCLAQTAQSVKSVGVHSSRAYFSPTSLAAPLDYHACFLCHTFCLSKCVLGLAPM
jgi:hypothetical protein